MKDLDLSIFKCHISTSLSLVSIYQFIGYCPIDRKLYRLLSDNRLSLIRLSLSVIMIRIFVIALTYEYSIYIYIYSDRYVCRCSLYIIDRCTVSTIRICL